MALEGSWSCDLPTWTVRPSWTTGPIVASRTALIVPGAYDAARNDAAARAEQHDGPVRERRGDAAAAGTAAPGDRFDGAGETGFEERGAKLGPRNVTSRSTANGTPSEVPGPTTIGAGSSTSREAKRSCRGVFRVGVAVHNCQSRMLPPP